MGKNLILLLAGALFLTPPLQADEVPQSNAENLTGAWQLVSYIQNGKDAPAKDVAGYRIVIESGKLTAYLNNSALKTAVLTVDPAKQPSTLTETDAKKQQTKSIYQLTGDTLAVCSAAPGAEPPKEFASAAGSKQDLWKFERIDPLQAPLILPGPKPLVYRSEKSGIVLYVERDRHYLSSVDKDGKILWHKHLTKDWKWDFRPDDYVASIGYVGKPSEGQLRGANETFGQAPETEYAYLTVDRLFGLINLRTGEFFGLGSD